MDILGSLPRRKCGNQFVFAINDHSMKFTHPTDWSKIEQRQVRYVNPKQSWIDQNYTLRVVVRDMDDTHVVVEETDTSQDTLRQEFVV